MTPQEAFEIVREESGRSNGFGYGSPADPDTPDRRIAHLDAIGELLRECRCCLSARWGQAWCGDVDEKLFRVQQAIGMEQDKARMRLLSAKEDESRPGPTQKQYRLVEGKSDDPHDYLVGKPMLDLAGIKELYRVACERGATNPRIQEREVSEWRNIISQEKETKL